MSEIIYADLKFYGREFKKDGVGKKGPWKLFATKFARIGEENPLKFTAFAGPKKGLCITTLTEGETYNIGYKSEEKTFTNQDNEEITYDARTIVFIGEIKGEATTSPKKEEEPAEPKVEEAVVDAPTTEEAVVDKADLLTEQPGDKEVVLNTPVVHITPTEDELVWLNKLKALPKAALTEADVKHTLDERLNHPGANRLDELYRWFQANGDK